MTSIAKNFEDLVFRNEKSLIRFTQDSPVYPNVWMEFLYQLIKEEGNPSATRVDLILTPHRDYSSNELFTAIKNSLRSYDSDYIESYENDWALSTNGETVAVRCTLRELFYCLLPHTWWFKEYIIKPKKNSNEFIWLMWVMGFLLADDKKSNPSKRVLESIFKDIFGNFQKGIKWPESKKLWSVSVNRKARVSIYKSVPATKADAARRLFDLDTSRITWAVLDTGIDATHKAFKDTSDDSNNPFPSRVIATYDFTNFRQLISRLNTADSTLKDIELMTSIKSNDFLGPTSTNKNRPLNKENKIQNLRDIQKALKSGRMIDWSILAPLLRIPHDKNYVAPKHPHGTHVGGIIGADNSKTISGNAKIIGMCPEIKLYDIRVLDDNGVGEEFNIIAAIQFVRWLNRQKDLLVIHGINLSLSINHEVESYACGRTPVCESCNRLFSEGTVIVTAAGNMGQAVYESPSGIRQQGFRTVNITDPGNAENVITVGATHRNKPHTYGISYFSSRGPTGDGRLKPDIVAPGEKITSTVPGNNQEIMDGTSMAAPHVSGAAAILLAKYRELIGNPKKVKEILCDSATDLNRERYFQGNGMLDVLRAIQSI
ncbi:S8 family peptidase [uncultured Croceitalea sp.]|uniref:S8 family peptidase n=1 Tax=uncultured Croceitalea sp. TaxID=1798908 RepID=UPI0033067296